MPWLAFLAGRYAADPYVWLSPMNEPNCAPQTADCYDWSVWQRQHRRYIEVIRAAGMRSPIVINTPAWSWDHARIDEFPLGDANLIYGVHRYANDNPTFSPAEAAECDQKWAAKAARHAMIVEEVGAYNGSQFANALTWNEGFIDYVTDWVLRRGGDGAIAFAWHWTDQNTSPTPTAPSPPGATPSPTTTSPAHRRRGRSRRRRPGRPRPCV